jgi:hypothetical protein
MAMTVNMAKHGGLIVRTVVYEQARQSGAGAALKNSLTFAIADYFSYWRNIRNAFAKVYTDATNDAL